MIPRAEGTKVRLSLSVEDPEAYLNPLNELVEAQESLDAHIGDLSSVQLQPFRERVMAAEADVEDALSEVVDIEHAEMVLRMLSKAIVEAKVRRGDFSRGDDAA